MDKIYCGNAKEKQVKLANGDSFEVLNMTIHTDKIKEHIEEFNGTNFVKIKVTKRREADQYGNTHSVEVDTWKPEEESF